MFFNDPKEQAPIKVSKLPRVYSQKRVETLSKPKSEAVNGFNSQLGGYEQVGWRAGRKIKMINF